MQVEAQSYRGVEELSDGGQGPPLQRNILEALTLRLEALLSAERDWHSHRLELQQCERGGADDES